MTGARPASGEYEHRRAGPLHRIVRRTAGWRPVSWFYSRALDPADRWVYRLSGGRAMLTSWLAGLPIALLTTRGARSGLERTVPVVAIPDGDAVIVIASNYGARRDPAWAFNLRADPAARVRIDGRERPLLARELAGADRDAAYRRGIDVYPGWIAYRRRAAPRVIPVFRLEPPAE